MSEVFKELYAVNVNDHKEGKNGLSYLSWTWAWAEVMERYPDATVEIVHFDGKPYLYDENLGYMVETIMTIDGISRMMWLPVMDGANKAMKDKAYTYQAKEYKYGKWTGNYIEKTVEAATMFNINTSIMRCMTKNIALFGLGLYIYAGEDLPEEEKQESQKPAYVTEAMIKTLKGEMKRTGKDFEWLSKRLRVDDMAKITVQQFKVAMDNFAKMESTK